MKIAIVRLSSLGDIILGMASLQFIRRHLPDCRITWIADSRFADILDHQKDIGQIIKIELKGMKKEKSLSSLFMEYHQLRSAGPFDAVIDLHGMIKSAVTAKILGKNTCGFDKGVIKEPLGCLFYRHTYEVPLDMPAACRYASLAMQSLGLPFREPDMSVIQPFLFARDDDFLIAKEYFSSERRNIIIVPETSAANKNYKTPRK